MNGRLLERLPNAVPLDVQTGGVEIAIPFQNVFEALHEQVPLKRLKQRQHRGRK